MNFNERELIDIYQKLKDDFDDKVKEITETLRIGLENHVKHTWFKNPEDVDKVDHVWDKFVTFPSYLCSTVKLKDLQKEFTWLTESFLIIYLDLNVDLDCYSQVPLEVIIDDLIRIQEEYTDWSDIYTNSQVKELEFSKLPEAVFELKKFLIKNLYKYLDAP